MKTQNSTQPNKVTETKDHIGEPYTNHGKGNWEERIENFCDSSNLKTIQSIYQKNKEEIMEDLEDSFGSELENISEEDKKNLLGERYESLYISNNYSDHNGDEQIAFNIQYTNNKHNTTEIYGEFVDEEASYIIEEFESENKDTQEVKTKKYLINNLLNQKCSNNVFQLLTENISDDGIFGKHVEKIEEITHISYKIRTRFVSSSDSKYNFERKEEIIKFFGVWQIKSDLIDMGFIEELAT